MKKRDMVIIGGGAGGLVVASVAAQLGLDVVLINKEEAMGGDCLHYGCVPSKSLLKSASVANIMSHADSWGLKPVKVDVDMSVINQRIKEIVDSIQVHDSRERFEALGCEVVTGEAKFSGPSKVVVAGREFDARRFVIATGSTALIPPIEGLQQTAYLTNEDMYSLPVLPKSLIILGAGPIGVEMAQAYNRLGSDVTVIEMASRILPRMDADLSESLREVLVAEGVTIKTENEVVAVSECNNPDGDSTGQKQVSLKNGDILTAEALLVAIGRRPVVEPLNLDKADVEYDVTGIKVNRRMQTSNSRIYACGDVTGEMPLTHVAELQAGVVIANAVFKIPKKIDYSVIPSVVYTEPEVAQVGCSVEQCLKSEKGELHQFDVAQLDRAITDNSKSGVAKLLTNKGRVTGAHIIGPHAGEMIHEMALAIQEKLSVSRISSLVHAYPSYSQLNKRVAGQYYKDRLFSPGTKKLVSLLNKIFP